MRRRKKPMGFASAETLATRARANFIARKRLLLESFSGHLHSAPNILVVLERYFAKQTVDYTRRPGATAAAWQEHGPEVELEEVRAAVKGAEAWDALVKRYAKPNPHREVHR